MIAICAQECRRKDKGTRLQEMENYLATKDFTNVSKEFVSMWEMWLVCFVK